MNNPLDDIMRFQKMIRDNSEMPQWYPTTHRHIKSGRCYRIEEVDDGKYWVFWTTDERGGIFPFPHKMIDEHELLYDYEELEQSDLNAGHEVRILIRELKEENPA